MPGLPVAARLAIREAWYLWGEGALMYRMYHLHACRRGSTFRALHPAGTWPRWQSRQAADLSVSPREVRRLVHRGSGESATVWSAWRRRLMN